MRVTLNATLTTVNTKMTVKFTNLNSNLKRNVTTTNSIKTMTRSGSVFTENVVFSTLPRARTVCNFLITVLLLMFSKLLNKKRNLPARTNVMTVNMNTSVNFTNLNSNVKRNVTTTSSMNTVMRSGSVFTHNVVFSTLPRARTVCNFLVTVLLVMFNKVLNWKNVLCIEREWGYFGRCI